MVQGALWSFVVRDKDAPMLVPRNVSEILQRRKRKQTYLFLPFSLPRYWRVTKTEPLSAWRSILDVFVLSWGTKVGKEKLTVARVRPNWTEFGWAAA